MKEQCLKEDSLNGSKTLSNGFLKVSSNALIAGTDFFRGNSKI